MNALVPATTYRAPVLRPRPRLAHLRLALDRSTNREVTQEGFLRVSNNVLSRVGPSPYKGHEIPDYVQFGLNPNREYMLLRRPDELRKSLPTWAGVPLLIDHRPISAEDLPAHLVIGAVIGDVTFDDDAVTGDLIVWSAPAVDAITSGRRAALSAGYSYRPVMVPGVWRGKKYDGQMTEILVQHVALIESGTGRVSGAMVADRMPLSLRRLGSAAYARQR
jgi:hypothetical protein